MQQSPKILTRWKGQRSFYDGDVLFLVVLRDLGGGGKNVSFYRIPKVANSKHLPSHCVELS